MQHAWQPTLAGCVRTQGCAACGDSRGDQQQAVQRALAVRRRLAVAVRECLQKSGSCSKELAAGVHTLPCILCSCLHVHAHTVGCTHAFRPRMLSCKGSRSNYAVSRMRLPSRHVLLSTAPPNRRMPPAADQGVPLQRC